jgi:hypothetical protein
MDLCQKSGRPAFWTLPARYPYTAAAAALFITQAFPPLFRLRTEWTEVFVLASKNLLAGRDFLAYEFGYAYPPFFALVSTPFTLLPQALSQFLFYLISFACLVFVVKSAWSLSGGGRLQGPGAKIERGEHIIFLAAIFCAGRFLFNALSHMQTDLLLAALVMAGCLALRSGRSFISATWIGLAAAIKCTPLLFAPYLAWRGKWLAALWLVVVAVGVNFLPDLAQRPPSGGYWAVEWYRLYIQPLGRENYVPGSWFTSIENNQSLAGAVKRILTTTLKRTPAGMDIVKKKSDLSPAALKAITLILYAMVTIPSAYAMWRRRRTTRPPRAAPDADALEFSIIMLLMLLLSPNSSRAHFGIMLLPAFCIGRIALSDHSRGAWTLLLLATFVSLICYNMPLNIFFIPTLWAGAVSLTTVLLLAGCIMGLPAGKAAPQ